MLERGRGARKKYAGAVEAAGGAARTLSSLVKTHRPPFFPPTPYGMAPPPPDDAALHLHATLHTLRTRLASLEAERSALLARCARAEDAAARALAAGLLRTRTRAPPQQQQPGPLRRSLSLTPAPPPVSTAVQRRALAAEEALAASAAARPAWREGERAASGRVATMRARLEDSQRVLCARREGAPPPQPPPVRAWQDGVAVDG